MGRGELTENRPVPGRSGKREASPDGELIARFTAGERRLDSRGRRITVLGAAPGAEHLGVLCRDRFGALVVEPARLRSFELVEAGAGERIECRRRRQRALSEPVSVMLDGDAAFKRHLRLLGAERDAEPMSDAQRRYLRTLCEQAGESFDETWSKREASRRIGRLKKALAGG